MVYSRWWVCSLHRNVREADLTGQASRPALPYHYYHGQNTRLSARLVAGANPAAFIPLSPNRMTKYILAFGNELYVLSERGFLTTLNTWHPDMDAATRFATTAKAIAALEKIGENHVVIVCNPD